METVNEKQINAGMKTKNVTQPIQQPEQTVPVSGGFFEKFPILKSWWFWASIGIVVF